MHIPEYAENKDAKLQGYYDINLARAQELAAKYGGKAYATVMQAYDAALAEARPDDFIFVGGSTFVVADLLEGLAEQR